MLTVAKAFVEEQKERERRKEREKERKREGPFMKRVTFGTRKSEKC